MGFCMKLKFIKTLLLGAISLYSKIHCGDLENPNIEYQAIESRAFSVFVRPVLLRFQFEEIKKVELDRIRESFDYVGRATSPRAALEELSEGDFSKKYEPRYVTHMVEHIETSKTVYDRADASCLDESGFLTYRDEISRGLKKAAIKKGLNIDTTEIDCDKIHEAVRAKK